MNVIRPAGFARRATGYPAFCRTTRHGSTSSPPQQPRGKDAEAADGNTNTKDKTAPAKTVAEQDAELKSRLEAMSGEGGAAGVEYENGTAEGLKKEVKRNMFRLI